MSVEWDVASIRLDELDLLWDFDDPAESEARFYALLPRARSEQDGAYEAETLTQLARAQGLQRRFGDAAATLDEAEQALRPADARGRLRLLLERGRLANTSGEPGRGREPFLAAWELAGAVGEDALAVDAAPHARHRRATGRGAVVERASDGARAELGRSACLSLGRIAREQHGLGPP